MIGDEIKCLKNVGLFQLKDATPYCQSLNAYQILPRTRQESDDLVSALLSLDLVRHDRNIHVSLDLYKTKDGGWRDSAGKLISYFNWLPNQLDINGGNYAGFHIYGVNQTVGWNDYNSNDKLNVVCTKRGERSGENKIRSRTKFE